MNNPHQKFQPLTDHMDQVLAQALSMDFPELIGIAERFTAQVRLNMRQPAKLPVTQSSLAADDRLLTVEEASRKLAVTEDYLYRHANQFPFTVRLGTRQLRFSLHGMELTCPRSLTTLDVRFSEWLLVTSSSSSPV